MSEKHPPGHPPDSDEQVSEPTGGTLIEETRDQLEPLLIAVIEVLTVETNPEPATFFSGLLDRLRGVSTELALLQLFFDLATTPFKSFDFSDDATTAVDQLLAGCESIALTMTAEVDREH